MRGLVVGSTNKVYSGTIAENYRDIMARTPIHPGEHLALELNELGMSAAELARQIDVPTCR